RETSRACARRRASGGEWAKMLDEASHEKMIGWLASDLPQMLSAARRVLELDSAPGLAEADSDGAVTAPARRAALGAAVSAALQSAAALQPAAERWPPQSARPGAGACA